MNECYQKWSILTIGDRYWLLVTESDCWWLIVTNVTVILFKSYYKKRFFLKRMCKLKSCSQVFPLFIIEKNLKYGFLEEKHTQAIEEG